MVDVYIEHSDLEISREDVEESTDATELLAWLKEQDRVASELAIMIEALKDDEHYNSTGLRRKLGFVKVSIMWIQNRLTALGVDDGVIPLSGGLKAHLKAMEVKLQEKNEKIKAQNMELQELRSQLAAYRKAEKKAKADA